MGIEKNCRSLGINVMKQNNPLAPSSFTTQQVFVSYSLFILSIAAAQWAFSTLQFRLIIVSFLAMAHTCPQQTSCYYPPNHWFPASCLFRFVCPRPPQGVRLVSKEWPPNISNPVILFHLPAIYLAIREFLPSRIYYVGTFSFFSHPFLLRTLFSPR